MQHVDRCKTLDNYIRTKGEMLSGLNFQGILIINGDDNNIRKIDLSIFKGVIKTFGLNHENNFRAEDISYDEIGMGFTFIYEGKDYQVSVPGYGTHNVYNALASLAVLQSLGKDLTWAIGKLSGIDQVRSHLQFFKGLNDCTVIDDNWGSNSSQIKAALEVIIEKGKDKVKIAVLGKIPHFGEYEEEQYEEIGRMIVDYGIDILVTLDSISDKIAVYAEVKGMHTDKIYYSSTNEQTLKILEKLLNSNSIVLFKVPINYIYEEIIQKLIIE